MSLSGSMENLSEYGLQEIIQLISNVTDSFTTALFLFDADRKQLALRGFHSLSRHIDPELTLQAGDSLIGWVAKNQKPLYIAQFDRDTRNLRLYLRDEKIKAFLAVPVGEVGVLCIDSKRNYVFSEKDQKLLQDFAQLIRCHLEWEAVSEKERSQRTALDFLFGIEELSKKKQPVKTYTVEALKQCRSFSKTDAAFMVMVHGKKDRYQVTAHDGMLRGPLKKTVLPVDLGLTGWVIRQERPLILRSMKGNQHKSFIFFPDDPCAHFHSYLGLPLTFFGRLYGVMNLIGYRENDWNEDELKALDAAGQIIITSILYLMNL